MRKPNDVSIISISVAAIVFGILFCLNNIIGSTLDIVFGICFIILGLALAVLSFYNKQSFISVQGVTGGIVLAFGITMIVWRGLVGYFIYYLVPFAFIVLGAFLIVEALLLLFVRNSKNGNLFLIEICSGVVMLTLGILAVTIAAVQFKAFNVIEGAILIIVGLYVLIGKIINRKKDD